MKVKKTAAKKTAKKSDAPKRISHVEFLATLLDATIMENDELKQKNDSLEKRLASINEGYDKISGQLARALSVAEKLAAEKQDASDEKAYLQSRIEKLRTERDELRRYAEVVGQALADSFNRHAGISLDK